MYMYIQIVHNWA